MATVSPSEIDDIRRHMAQIRRELHEDIRGVVEGAEAATDWRRYVRNYPWACVGAAALLGFLVVPRRHRPTTIHVAAASPVTNGTTPAAPVVETKRGKGIVRTVAGLALPFILRAGKGYALQFLEQWLTQKMAEAPLGGPLAGFAAAFGQAGLGPNLAQPGPFPGPGPGPAPQAKTPGAPGPEPGPSRRF